MSAELFFAVSTQYGQGLIAPQARIEELMFTFAQAFALDICSYAVMSNHYHLVIKMAVHDAKKWSAAKWSALASYF